jgi:hypothetical protein
MLAPSRPGSFTCDPRGGGGVGVWRVDRQIAEPLRPPLPVGEGGTGGRAGARVQEESSFPDEG